MQGIYRANLRDTHSISKGYTEHAYRLCILSRVVLIIFIEDREGGLCYKDVTKMLQRCYNSVHHLHPEPRGWPGVLRECYESVARVLRECYESVTREHRIKR
jgi:hypothetical protein